MKLLQLNVTANWGSTGKIAEGIGQVAMSRGWESYIAFGRYFNPSKSQLIRVGTKRDVYLHYARHRIFDGEGLGSKVSTRRLIKEIGEIKPDIIQLHNIHDHWLNYPLLFDYLATVDTPVVWTFHDCWAFTGGCPYFESPKCDKWKNQCAECPLHKLGFDRSSSHFASRKSLYKALENRLCIVPVSKWLEDYSKESIVGNCEIKLIYNGIDTDKFNIIGEKSIKPMVLGVASVWESRKGLNDFFKLRHLLPQDSLDITLVGLTDRQIKMLPKGITGIKRTQNIDELVELYNRASVFVNPTYADNFPTTNLESLGCGTPVITYQTGGSPEAVDSKTGLVIPVGNVEALADGVMEVINTPARFTAQDCRERVVRLFDKDTQFGKYIDLYNSLLHY